MKQVTLLVIYKWSGIPSFIIDTLKWKYLVKMETENYGLTGPKDHFVLKLFWKKNYTFIMNNFIQHGCNKLIKIKMISEGSCDIED